MILLQWAGIISGSHDSGMTLSFKPKHIAKGLPNNNKRITLISATRISKELNENPPPPVLLHINYRARNRKETKQ